MPTKCEAFTRPEVPDLDRPVDGTARKASRVEVQADDTIRVSLKYANALSSPPIPHTHRVVHAAGDKFRFVEL